MPLQPMVNRFSLIALVFTGIVALSGTTAPAYAQDESTDESVLDDDPLEPFNRSVFFFNTTVDGLILRPSASIYNGVLPREGRDMVSNFINNIYTPVTFFNSVLQGDPNNSFASLWRFILNTTFGIGGLFDFASEAGLKNRSTDMGVTFALYGADKGPFLMLPIIGPSNARDAFGRLGDAFINPFNYIDNGTSIALWTTTAIDARSTHMKLIDDVYRSSLDPYSTFRSGYTQKRSEDVRRAKKARKKALENATTTQ
jgi:phospholipid-binding lipoprotein MlaA